MATGKHPAPRLKRVYEARVPEDGTRVLVERLWPRGVRKEDPRVDLWLKDIAPTPDLRTWFAHDPAKWAEFQHRYRAELAANPDAVAKLRALLGEGPVTLVYAARDEERNSARLLLEWLREGD
ncbi:MAG TPA: DUF488 domain-containing protein [bacterium]|nr:DUF488 domain-containing protein [bacterium]